MALLQRLVEGGPGGAGLTVATTHMGLLTTLKYRDPRFENASVEFDEASLRPTYRVLWGIPGRSNALNIAARLGLPADILADARQRLDPESASVAGIAADMEASRAALDAVEAELAELEAERARLEQVRGAEKQARREAAKVEVRRLRRELSGAIREAKVIIQRVKQDTWGHEDQASAGGPMITPVPVPVPASTPAPRELARWQPRVTETVMVPKLGMKGKVTGIKGRLVEVQVGVMKTQVDVDEVQPP